ncbi:hypothetical protein EYE40_07025 [Glaciihabitans arcticus]|uniref:Uncharacterized protein n=1 Tax=Glaciihabitans arcticus TaxID=2668039 RepID=A0A4Q9GR95_9MICO|nr:hypothetical protein [Glaciihabitans arcticus]TBN57171.1 hypothetical protein EYE40_07025 [Glaciihabitans arcticus]
MKRIYYASGSFLTGSAIADAIVAYADALAHSEGSDVVNFPILHDDGTPGEASMLIGPASQLACSTAPEHHAELENDVLVADLAKRSLQIGAPRPMMQAQSEIETTTDFD